MVFIQLIQLSVLINVIFMKKEAVRPGLYKLLLLLKGGIFENDHVSEIDFNLAHNQLFNMPLKSNNFLSIPIRYFHKHLQE